MTGLGQVVGELHREAAGLGGADQLLGVRAGSVLEARIEGERALPGARAQRHRALALLELPRHSALAIRAISSSRRRCGPCSLPACIPPGCSSSPPASHSPTPPSSPSGCRRSSPSSTRRWRRPRRCSARTRSSSPSPWRWARCACVPRACRRRLPRLRGRLARVRARRLARAPARRPVAPGGRCRRPAGRHIRARRRRRSGAPRLDGGGDLRLRRRPDPRRVADPGDRLARDLPRPGARRGRSGRRSMAITARGRASRADPAVVARRPRRRPRAPLGRARRRALPARPHAGHRMVGEPPGGGRGGVGAARRRACRLARPRPGTGTRGGGARCWWRAGCWRSPRSRARRCGGRCCRRRWRAPAWASRCPRWPASCSPERTPSEAAWLLSARHAGITVGARPARARRRHPARRRGGNNARARRGAGARRPAAPARQALAGGGAGRRPRPGRPARRAPALA